MYSNVYDDVTNFEVYGLTKITKNLQNETFFFFI